MSVQPQNEQGSIIATCQLIGLFKIFDIRRSTTSKLFNKKHFFYFFYNLFYTFYKLQMQ